MDFGFARAPKRRLFVTNGHVVDRDSGDEYEPVEAANRLSWTTALEADFMPPHQYTVFDVHRPSLEADVLLTAIKQRPDAYDAYFRGYATPMRYLELPDGLRYWRTVLNRTHMLNRCTLDSVEPPRRVDQGAKPEPWIGPKWAPNGSPWPPGYVEMNGRYVYDARQDPRRGFRCGTCSRTYWLAFPERPCPRCGTVQDQADPALQGIW